MRNLAEKNECKESEGDGVRSNGIQREDTAINSFGASREKRRVNIRLDTKETQVRPTSTLASI